MTVYKMIVFKKIQFAKTKSKNAKINNLKELPKPHNLPQGVSAKNVKGGVKISKTCLPSFGPPCLPKILEKG